MVNDYDSKFKLKKERVELMRHINRKEIFKYLLIGIEELRIKKSEMKSELSDFQNDVLDKDTNVFQFASLVTG